VFAFSSPALADTFLIDVDAIQNDTDHPIEVFLEAGSYTVTPVGVTAGRVYDGWQPWGDDTSCETPDGCEQTVPTTETGWKNAYDVISDALTEVRVNGAPLTPIEAEPTDAAGIQDYWLADPAAPHRYHVDDALVFPTAADAIATAEPSVFTVSDAGLVGFSIRDIDTQDNLGGVSLEVTPVPEPPETPALAIGFAWLALHGRRHQNPPEPIGTKTIGLRAHRRPTATTSTTTWSIRQRWMRSRPPSRRVSASGLVGLFDPRRHHERQPRRHIAEITAIREPSTTGCSRSA